MSETVWFAAKPGEERRFVSAVPYSPQFAVVLRAEGFRIFRITFQLPAGWDSAEFAVRGIAEDMTDVE